VRQQDREAGQVACSARPPRIRGTRCRARPAALDEQERLQKEKAVIGFFISGHPLAKYRAEVELFGTRTTATLGEWSDQR